MSTIDTLPIVTQDSPPAGINPGGGQSTILDHLPHESRVTQRFFDGKPDRVTTFTGPEARERATSFAQLTAFIYLIPHADGCKSHWNDRAACTCYRRFAKALASA